MSHSTLMTRFLALGLFASLCACSFAPPVSPRAPEVFHGQGTHRILVVSHGWHTGVLLPADALQALQPALVKRFPRAHYLEFGWGDRDYYQALEKNFGTTLKAALWPSSSVIRVIGIDDVDAYSRRVSSASALCLNDAELAGILDFVSGSLHRTEASALEALPGGSSRSQFYAARGSYHLFNTCNSWTAKALASLGMDLMPRTYLTAGGVMDYLRAQANGSPTAACPA